MNLGTIWGKLDKTDRELIFLCLTPSDDRIESIISGNRGKMIFVDIEYVLKFMVENISHMDGGLFYSETIDHEESRTKRIIRLIEAELK